MLCKSLMRRIIVPCQTSMKIDDIKHLTRGQASSMYSTHVRFFFFFKCLWSRYRTADDIPHGPYTLFLEFGSLIGLELSV